ncbi:FAD dependent oxidoreductase [Xylogone sp. PMI_703]|nr:FAD dependent oxidoreductase [Xylogone sp. PMI_703]
MSTEDLYLGLVSKIQADPGLPCDHPTTATWQEPPHSTVSATQSEQLGERTDFAIIGSGVTGCSVAKRLLESSSSGRKTVTVFEARTLTSGATGRNGGHLASPIPGEFETTSQRFGRDAAIDIARFCRRTLELMMELAVSHGAEIEAASEVRKVESIVAFYSEDTFNAATRSTELYMEALPEERDSFEIISGKTAEEEFNIKNSVGAITSTSGVFWPYRLITRIFAHLVSKYPQRLNIETQTPVISVTYSSNEDMKYPYVINTPRGSIRAAKVIHCTNGWTGHLLPKLRGSIFPIRGTMSCQKSGPLFPNIGGKRSWNFYSGPQYHSDSAVFEGGLYYMQQNQKTGDIFIGGEMQHVGDLISADDSSISSLSRDNLATILPKVFKLGWESETAEIQKVWSGVMGFTPDHLPLVGELTHKVTDRGLSGGEYLAAGFNGYGMSHCWSSGEAVAMMALGEGVPKWLPKEYG